MFENFKGGGVRPPRPPIYPPVTVPVNMVNYVHLIDKHDTEMYSIRLLTTWLARFSQFSISKRIITDKHGAVRRFLETSYDSLVG